MGPLERSVERAFIRRCKKCKIWQFKLGLYALPDRVALMSPARIEFVEFKRPGETPRKNQVHTIRRLRRLGFTVHVIDNSKDAIALVNMWTEEEA